MLVDGLTEIHAAVLWAQGGDGTGGLLQFLPAMAAIAFVFYFVLLRPQQREAKQRQSLLDNIKKNDRVVTIGGIYGVVTNVRREADEVTIKVDEANNTKLRITLSSIARITAAESGEEAVVSAEPQAKKS